MNRLYNLKRFLNNYSGTQVFNTRNLAGDKLEVVYNQNGIIIEYCSSYDYLEIFGLNCLEWKNIIEKNDIMGNVVRDFEEFELYEEEV